MSLYLSVEVTHLGSQNVLCKPNRRSFNHYQCMDKSELKASSIHPIQPFLQLCKFYKANISDMLPEIPLHILLLAEQKRVDSNICPVIILV